TARDLDSVFGNQSAECDDLGVDHLAVEGVEEGFATLSAVFGLGEFCDVFELSDLGVELRVGRVAQVSLRLPALGGRCRGWFGGGRRGNLCLGGAFLSFRPKSKVCGGG